MAPGRPRPGWVDGTLTSDGEGPTRGRRSGTARENLTAGGSATAAGPAPTPIRSGTVDGGRHGGRRGRLVDAGASRGTTLPIIGAVAGKRMCHSDEDDCYAGCQVGVKISRYSATIGVSFARVPVTVQEAKIATTGRHLALALAVVFVAGSCSALADDPLTALLPSDAAVMSPARPLGSGRAPRDGTGGPRESSPARPPGPTALPTEASESKPAPTVVRLRPRPRPGPFEMNLYTKGDFVHQQTKDWCVAGSTQTMMNIIDKGRPDRSASFQERLYLKGRRLSPAKRKLGPIGVDLKGWAELLNSGGYGPYLVDGAGTRRAAIRKAARALRLTGRPVGLVTWRGAHSWVMSGFTATADPASDKDYEVTAVYIQDTWYPYVSTIWGASRPPNALVPVAALAEDYLPYRRPRARYPDRDGRFMLILPALPPNTVAR